MQNETQIEIAGIQSATSFFYTNDHHQDLHSFPTRRSSDPQTILCRSLKEHVPSRVRQFVCRSEEHTSELQSLTNLVCRLLLEKKKKAKMYDETEKERAVLQLRTSGQTAKEQV